MRYIFFLCLLSFAIGCNNAPKAKQATVPGDKEIKAAVIALYESFNGAAGGGGRHVEDVTVLRKRNGDSDEQYYVEVDVKGTEVGPPLATPVPDKTFTETRELQLIWKDGVWKCEGERQEE